MKTLEELLVESAKRVAQMSKEEYDEMIQAQRESWVRSVIDWPKPKFHYEGGVKVYDSYEDYCND